MKNYIYIIIINFFLHYHIFLRTFYKVISGSYFQNWCKNVSGKVYLDVNFLIFFLKFFFTSYFSNKFKDYLTNFMELIFDKTEIICYDYQ